LPNRLIFVSDFVLRTAFPTTIPAIARRIYNGIDLTAFDPATHPATDLRKELDLTPEQPLVVMIGYLDLIKGQHEVIEAWPQVLRTYPTARLVLVGRAITPNGEVYAAALRTQVKTLGIEANVTFLGYRSDISAILHAADIYVSFTLNDTLSMVVIEAMTMRKAIIGANSGGLPELITPHESGLLVDKGDIAGMAQAIQDLLADPSVRQRYGTTAREKALSQFDIQQCVTAIQQVYDELC
jgi:glycosyltransferase involved in cell wall biosynthesis